MKLDKIYHDAPALTGMRVTKKTGLLIDKAITEKGDDQPATRDHPRPQQEQLPNKNKDGDERQPLDVVA